MISNAFSEKFQILLESSEMKSKYLKIRFIFQPFEGFELGFIRLDMVFIC